MSKEQIQTYRLLKEEASEPNHQEPAMLGRQPQAPQGKVSQEIGSNTPWVICMKRPSTLPASARGQKSYGSFAALQPYLGFDSRSHGFQAFKEAINVILASLWETHIVIPNAHPNTFIKTVSERVFVTHINAHLQWTTEMKNAFPGILDTEERGYLLYQLVLQHRKRWASRHMPKRGPMNMPFGDSAQNAMCRMTEDFQQEVDGLWTTIENQEELLRENNEQLEEHKEILGQYEHALEKHKEYLGSQEADLRRLTKEQLEHYSALQEALATMIAANNEGFRNLEKVLQKASPFNE